MRGRILDNDAEGERILKWVRFEHEEQAGFGVLVGDTITRHDGELFGTNSPTADTVQRSAARLLAPCMPSKIVAMWNNFHELANKNGDAIPTQPLYFIKPPSCVIGPEADIVRPQSYDGRIFCEAELGLVIGTTCRNVAVDDALTYLKGYTCVNDVTALQLIDEDEAFQQWTRAKSFDTFGALGPVIAELDDPADLQIRLLLNGRERQNYPAGDMIFSPAQLVSAVSQDMTLLPGDVIACGTSVGVLPMKPGATVEVTIDGIGTLKNTFVDQSNEK